MKGECVMAQTNNEQTVQEKYPIGVFYTKIYRVIPKNCVLLVRSKFSGQNVEIRKGGWTIVAPWKEAKLVSLAEKTIDYPKMEFDDLEGQSIFIDYAITVRIVNPIKYEYAHQNIDEALKIMISSAVRVLVKKAEFEEMAGRDFSINQGETNTNIKNDDFSRKLQAMAQQFLTFEQKYGLKIVSFESKDIQQSPELQKVYDERIRRRKEGEAKQEEAKKQQEVARIDAETRKIKALADADAYKIEHQAKNEVLANKRELELKAIQSGLTGLSEAQRMEVIKAYVLANGDNPHTSVFASVNNRDMLKTAVVNSMPETDGKGQKVKK